MRLRLRAHAAEDSANARQAALQRSSRQHTQAARLTYNAIDATARQLRSPLRVASCAPPARTIARTPARCSSRSRTAARSRSGARPITRPTAGTLCTKVARYLDRTYSPDRLLLSDAPRRRARAKAASRASRWDEALDEIAERFRAIAASPDGPQAILPYSYAGTMGLLQGASMDRRFFHRLGASLLDRTICASAGKAGWAASIGASMGMDVEAIRRQQADPDLGQQPDHVEPAFLDARAGSEAARREADRDRPVSQRDRRKVPRAHRAAAGHRRRAGARHHARADRATDASIATTSIATRSASTRSRERAREWTPERVAATCGIPREQVDPARARLRHDQAGGDPPQLRHAARRRRRQRRARGRLPAGAGRRVARSGRRRAAFVVRHVSGRLGGARAPRPDPRHAAHDQHVGDRRCADAVERSADSRDLRLQLESGGGRAGFVKRRRRIFARRTCSASCTRSSRTDTADYADILLPATTQLEQTTSTIRTAISTCSRTTRRSRRIGEALPNTEVFRRLAARMGFSEPCFRESDDDLARQAYRARRRARAGHRLGRAEAGRLAAAQRAPAATRRSRKADFPTPSGKCEFWSETLARAGPGSAARRTFRRASRRHPTRSSRRAIRSRSSRRRRAIS